MTRRPELNTSQRVVALIEANIGEQSLNPMDKIFELDQFTSSNFTKLTEFQPEIIICPLFTMTFDAIDVGKMMVDTLVDAKLLLLSPTLPRPGMVLHEIKEACPNLNVDYFNLVRWNNVRLLSA
ncbi:MAG: hypothetical protein P8L32_03950 [Paracoccaceae bacterium]|jgi:hypothetical protein|nr:hypothetical protein [Paracoccaceae bacterium]